MIIAMYLYACRLVECRSEAARATQACSQLQHSHSQLQTQLQDLHSSLQQRDSALQASLAQKAELEELLRGAREEIAHLREGEGEGEESREGLVEEVARLELEIERLSREGEEREEEMTALQNQLKVRIMNVALAPSPK